MKTAGIHQSIPPDEAAFIYLMHHVYGNEEPSNKQYFEGVAVPISEETNSKFHQGNRVITPSQVVSLIRHIKNHKLRLEDFVEC